MVLRAPDRAFQPAAGNFIAYTTPNAEPWADRMLLLPELRTLRDAVGMSVCGRPRSGKETEHLQRKQLLVGPRLRHRRDTNIPAVTILSRIWTLLVP